MSVGTERQPTRLWRRWRSVARLVRRAYVQVDGFAFPGWHRCVTGAWLPRLAL